MALDVSAVSYESGRKALQLAVDGGSSIAEIASLLAEEAEEHRKSSSLDPISVDGAKDLEVASSCSSFDSIDGTLDQYVSSCDHHTALEVAASAGHMNAIKRLLEAGADPNAPVHEMGTSVLEAAAAQGQLDVVQKLLETGSHPDHCGESSPATPLIAAAKAGHIEICKALLRSGADVSIWRKSRAVEHGTSSAIEAAVETSSITLLELFLGSVEDAAKDYVAGDLKAAIVEGRQKDSKRLLRTEKVLSRAKTSINHALPAAAATGNTLILQRLLDAGADITAKHETSGYYIGNFAITTAAKCGHLEATNKLLELDSDQDNLTADALTRALQSAVDFGRMALIQPLLQAGADATKIDIREAVAAGHLDVLKFILQSGALVDVDVSKRRIGLYDITALHLAAYHGHQAVVDLLLAKGADVNECVGRADIDGTNMKGSTAVSCAAVGGHLAVMKRLIDAGADVNPPCVYADTALEAAVRAGDTVMLELLLAAGAVVDDGDGGKSALSIAAEVNNPDLVARLISIMPPEDAREFAPLALLEAAKNQNADLVRQLLQLHPNVNLEVEGTSLLQVAAQNDNLEILEMLLSEGADVNFNPSEGREQTALQSASERGDLVAVKLLLAAGAEVNATGWTAPPLLLAIRGGHVAVFEHLLAAGADIYATAYRGQTMLEAAEDSGNADIQGRVRAVLDSQPPPQIGQPHERGTGPLCETCRMAPLADLFWNFYGPVELHPSLTALRVSAAAGCPFCCFLWKRLGTTSILMPQTSRVVLTTMRRLYNIYCRVIEPFPPENESHPDPRTRIELPYSLPFVKDSRIPITEDTSSLETCKQIGIWLHTCKNEHPKCRASLENASLPTRLIYLETSRCSGLSHQADTTLHPKLISTNGMDFLDCKYIALSYRWPQNFPAEAKSTRDNISQQMRGLNTSKLPQIFNHVFKAAIRMGISYIWIDSLCIVQDDPDDWRREAALMIQIYRYAEFTVAAAVPTTNPDLGLFRYGDPSDVLSVRLPGVRDPDGDGLGQEVVIMKPQKEKYGESPLVTRGWCFQEREISQRIVYYTETQVLWECRTVQASEGLPNGVRSDGVNASIEYGRTWTGRILDKDLGQVDNTWRAAVEDYSARNLTVFTDKLPALAGMAAAIQEYKPANCRYLAGLWEDDFLEGLRWYSQATTDFGNGPYPRQRRTITNTRYSRYVAPTWSWASVAGHISYMLADTPQNQTPPTYALKILNIDVQTSTGDPYGAVSDAVLTCTAGLVPGVLWDDRLDPHGTDHELRTANRRFLGKMSFDAPQDRYEGDGVQVVFCIHLGSDLNGVGLAVLPTGNRENEYRRVGIVKEMDRHPFYVVEIKKITIV